MWPLLLTGCFLFEANTYGFEVLSELSSCPQASRSPQGYYPGSITRDFYSIPSVLRQFPPQTSKQKLSKKLTQTRKHYITCCFERHFRMTTIWLLQNTKVLFVLFTSPRELWNSSCFPRQFFSPILHVRPSDFSLCLRLHAGTSCFLPHQSAPRLQKYLASSPQWCYSIKAHQRKGVGS